MASSPITSWQIDRETVEKVADFIFGVGLQNHCRVTVAMKLQMFKLVLEKAEEPEIKLPTSAGSSKKQERYRKNIYFCFIDYAKAFDCVDHKNIHGKFLKRWEYQTILLAS